MANYYEEMTKKIADLVGKVKEDCATINEESDNVIAEIKNLRKILQENASKQNTILNIVDELTVELNEMYADLDDKMLEQGEMLSVLDGLDEDEDDYICDNCGAVVSKDQIVMDEDCNIFCSDECCEEFAQYVEDELEGKADEDEDDIDEDEEE